MGPAGAQAAAGQGSCCTQQACRIAAGVQQECCQVLAANPFIAGVSMSAHEQTEGFSCICLALLPCYCWLPKAAHCQPLVPFGGRRAGWSKTQAAQDVQGMHGMFVGELGRSLVVRCCSIMLDLQWCMYHQ